MNLEDLSFDSNGLITAVIKDVSTREVLMLA